MRCLSFQASVRPSTLALAVDRVRRAEPSGPILLVCEQVSVETAKLLRRRGVQFVDAAGNAYLDAPDFLVVIDGRRRAVPARGRADRIGRAALQVMFVLLRDPDAAKLSVRGLGAQAGVSHGAAASALQAFDGRGWIRLLGRQGHGITNPHGMLDAWLVGYAGQLAPKLEATRATAPGVESPSAWASGVVAQMAPGWCLLGGEAAAEIAGHPVRGVGASVYVRRWDAPTMRRLRLVPAGDGPIRVLRAFAPRMEDPSDGRLVDPLIVLGEIVAIPDERLDGTREALRLRVCERFPHVPPA